MMTPLRPVVFRALTFLVLCASPPSTAQLHPSFYNGETLTYKAYFHWGFIWLHAGAVVFMAEPRYQDDRPYLHFLSTGTTLKPFDLLFKVRDRFESLADPSGLWPHEFHRNTREGKHAVELTYRFQKDPPVIHTRRFDGDTGFVSDTMALKPGTRDVLTSIYFSRTIDYEHLEKGSRIPLTMIIDHVIHDLDLIYEGRETVQIERRKKQSCYRISIRLEKGTLFKGGETLTAWITADERRIPLVVESTVIVGSVKAILAEGSATGH